MWRAINRYFHATARSRNKRTYCSLSKEEALKSLKRLSELKPKEPGASECCGNYCQNCVWVVYMSQLEDYEREKKELEKIVGTENREEEAFVKRDSLKRFDIDPGLKAFIDLELKLKKQ
eukprot:TRINITY_DN11299_c0_g1_i1.p1 TRINITY_DN11299_c0_g1~~TRINITY_DN11299_c0_g1_i1.p1  ORF type:complete len:119 (-),score=22.80 TRINITY_DN11299_c0_g1_i1:113-469(-)